MRFGLDSYTLLIMIGILILIIIFFFSELKPPAPSGNKALTNIILNTS